MGRSRQEYLNYFRYMENEHIKSNLGGMAFDDVVWHFHNAVDVDKLFTEDELIKMFPKLLQSQEQNELFETKVIYYEVGYEIPNILESGSTYQVHWKGKSETEAFKEFGKRNNNYILRFIYDGEKFQKQMYDSEHQKWE